MKKNNDLKKENLIPYPVKDVIGRSIQFKPHVKSHDDLLTLKTALEVCISKNDRYNCERFISMLNMNKKTEAEIRDINEYAFGKSDINFIYSEEILSRWKKSKYNK